MRTTVTLPPEVAEFVDLYADAQGVSRSRAVSDLILRIMPRKPRVKIVDGVPLLDVPTNGRKTSYEDVKRIESEGY
jgi:CopG-like RHH_1 or ribbon-helix-helix domain, RHH_5